MKSERLLQVLLVDNHFDILLSLHGTDGQWKAPNIKADKIERGARGIYELTYWRLLAKYWEINEDAKSWLSRHTYPLGISGSVDIMGEGPHRVFYTAFTYIGERQRLGTVTVSVNEGVSKSDWFPLTYLPSMAEPGLDYAVKKLKKSLKRRGRQSNFFYTEDQLSLGL